MNKEIEYPLISIIIPIYNGEKYIKECIESVIKQTYKNIEIIIINDGSTDNSKNICVDFKEKDNRIILINKKNSGVSDSRNLGIKESKGKFIMFIDSDDYIQQNYIEEIFKCIKKENLDICKTGIVFFNNKKQGIKTYLKKDKFKILSKEEILSEISKSSLFNAPFAFLIKDEIVKNNSIKFDKDISYGEDLLFFWQCVKYSKRIGYLNECGYHYRINKNSAVHSTDTTKKIKFIQDNIQVYKEFILTGKYENDFLILLYRKFNYAYKYIIRGKISYEEFKKIVYDTFYNINLEYRKRIKIKKGKKINIINKLEILLLKNNMYFCYYILISIIKKIHRKD